MKKWILSIAVLFFAFQMKTAAQNLLRADDAFRFSQTGLYGSAAAAGKAGSIGALGGDFSSAVYNPAGLGLFYRSEISFSPMFSLNNVYSNYKGQEDYHISPLFNIGTFSSIFSWEPKNNENIKAVQFGMGYNRINKFKNKTAVQGESDHSIADAWRDLAQGTPYNQLNDFTTDLAYRIYLIDTITGSDRNYFSAVTAGQPVLQSKIIDESGYQGEYNFSFSANLKDFFYFGGTIGVPHLNYKRTSTYTEEDIYQVMPNFDRLTFEETSHIEGNGINFKLGAIVRAQDWLRIGIAYHTPSLYYNMTNEYKTALKASVYPYYKEEWVTSDDHFNGKPLVEKYKMITPAKYIGSLAFVWGNQDSKIAGSISADYEYVDYSTMSYYNTNSHLNIAANRQIKDTYRGAHNIRTGGQLNVGEYAFRLGYAFYNSPYKNQNTASDRNMITTGIGYKTKEYYIDLAYVHALGKGEVYLYESQAAEPAQLTYAKNTLLLTLGWRF